jgi:hypothetical protein
MIDIMPDVMRFGEVNGVHISIPKELGPVAPGNVYDRLGVVQIRREWS